jgi:hypothetical protein
MKSDEEPVAFRRVGIIVFASAAYRVLVPVLGFYTASALFLFGSAMVLNDTKVSALLSACLLTAIMCLAVWLGFSVLLGVPVPGGLLL